MTIFDAMLIVLGFFGSPLFVFFAGLVLVLGGVCAVIELGRLSAWNLLWIIPEVFLGISLAVWAMSSAQLFEWVAR